MNYVLLALLFALLIGIVAGLRAMTPLAVLAWGAFLGWINLADAPHGHWSSWLGNVIAVVLLSILAIGELITDQLPKTPSRKVPAQFGTRILIGALAGAVIGTPFGHIFSAIGAGMIGAVLGTMGGAQARGALAAKFGNDRPAALIEDAIAIVGGFVIVYLAGVSLA
ncbi:DUF4126 family protein [Mycolicibacterium sp. P1-5]|uniref:DUF4126 family protein n=1 Tax=Mycolicibacterium sp. P1-5 TaxID=2024617 RepID=UPI0011EEF5EF|nr:DUF4126 family protein [Mycolicibacterium sp. P1-5]KAA0109530.1 DUF4126 family protein [Mycolicibacterium sp. P1-5]